MLAPFPYAVYAMLSVPFIQTTGKNLKAPATTVTANATPDPAAKADPAKVTPNSTKTKTKGSKASKK